MRPLFITAASIVSALGRGDAATLDALRSRRSGLQPCNFHGICDGYVGMVDGLEQHRLASAFARYDCRNNRLADLALRTDGFDAAVRRAVARYGPDRVAVVVGTSTSGILETEEAYFARDGAAGVLPAGFDYDHTHDLHSLARFVRETLGLRGPALTVSTACASSARSFVDAYHLIASGICDAAVVGGCDTLCRMTLRGFAALDIIAPGPCRPCDAARDGISIGEGASFALLEPDGAAVALLGYGVSSDGHHMSAPHPEGAGAVVAMRAALDRAGLAPAAIDYVNLHGTGTRANDAMEDHAVVEVFGRDVACSSTKGWTGHTLAAAGIVEARIAALCIEAGLMPGCLGVASIDPSFAAYVLTANKEQPVRSVISNSFGFGGANCSLIFGRPG